MFTIVFMQYATDVKRQRIKSIRTRLTPRFTDKMNAILISGEKIHNMLFFKKITLSALVLLVLFLHLLHYTPVGSLTLYKFTPILFFYCSIISRNVLPSTLFSMWTHYCSKGFFLKQFMPVHTTEKRTKKRWGWGCGGGGFCSFKKMPLVLSFQVL